MIGHFMVDRLHVSTTSRDVVRHVYGMLAPSAKVLAKRNDRRTLYRAALAAHEENRKVYAYVMGSI